MRSLTQTGQLCNLCKFTRSLLKKRMEKGRSCPCHDLMKGLNSMLQIWVQQRWPWNSVQTLTASRSRTQSVRWGLGGVTVGPAHILKLKVLFHVQNGDSEPVLFSGRVEPVLKDYHPNQWEKASVERLSPRSMGESLSWKIITRINGRKPLLKDYHPNQWESATATVVPLRVKSGVFYGLLGNHKTHSLNKGGLWFMFKL